MKLLIVDDEELTRNGIISSVDFEALGITDIYTADDGINGLIAAEKYKPDIILSDVRMPRMDGIAMLTELSVKMPNLVAIFMSGYSDKEYLKAAIKLKAINYIEKPIQPVELTEALIEATAEVPKKKWSEKAPDFEEYQLTSRLAFALTTPYSSISKEVDQLSADYSRRYSSDKFKYVLTFVLKSSDPIDSDVLTFSCQELKKHLAKKHLHVICSDKRMQHAIFHIYGEDIINTETISDLKTYLCELFFGITPRYIAFGSIQHGIKEAYLSYESAVAVLESAFFAPENSVLCGSDITNPKKSTLDLTNINDDFSTMLKNRKKDDCLALVQKLHDDIAGSGNLFKSQIKTLYFDLLSSLSKIRRNALISTAPSGEQFENILELIDGCFSFDSLSRLLSGKVISFFNELSESNSENPTIYLIKEYIEKNYTDCELSVKDISDYAKLSVSYACTFFKQETGVTLNQYITDYRIEKARTLLLDPRNKVSDISSAVGYRDGNYFSKAFRKHTGASPSEFRDSLGHHA